MGHKVDMQVRYTGINLNKNVSFQIFPGNSDPNSVVCNVLNETYPVPLQARHVRVYIVYVGAFVVPGLRMELYGGNNSWLVVDQGTRRFLLIAVVNRHFYERWLVRSPCMSMGFFRLLTQCESQSTKRWDVWNVPGLLGVALSTIYWTAHIAYKRTCAGCGSHTQFCWTVLFCVRSASSWSTQINSKINCIAMQKCTKKTHARSERSLRRRNENAASPSVNHSKSNSIVYLFCILCLCIILYDTSKASKNLTFILKQSLILPSVCVDIGRDWSGTSTRMTEAVYCDS